MSQTRRLAVILAADVTGYSRLDEEGSLDPVRPRRSMDARTCFAETRSQSRERSRYANSLVGKLVRKP
jgi:hypothetical protein